VPPVDQQLQLETLNSIEAALGTQDKEKTNRQPLHKTRGRYFIKHRQDCYYHKSCRQILGQAW